MTTPAIVTACRAMNRQYVITDDARIESGAFKYRRERDLDVVMGHVVPIPQGNDPEPTRRIIIALEAKLRFQHPYARLRRKMIEVAIAGEKLTLEHQLAEGEVVK